MKKINKKNAKADHYRNVPEELKKRTPKPKFSLNSPHLTAAIAPQGFSSFVPGSFINAKPEKKKKRNNIFNKLTSATKIFFIKHKIKFLYLLLFLFIISGITYLGWYFQPIQTMKAATERLAGSGFTEADQIEWAHAVESFTFFDFPDPLQGAEEGKFSKALMSYVNSFEKFNDNNYIKLPSIEILEAKETQIDIDPPIVTKDENLVLGSSYTVAGRDFSFEKYMSCKLKIATETSPDLYFLIAKVKTQLGETEIKGTAPLDDVLVKINESFDEIKSELKAKNIENLSKLLIGTDRDQLTALVELDPEQKKIANLKLYGSITATDSAFATKEIISLGKLDVTNDGKNTIGQLDIFYNTLTRSYLLDGLFTLIPTIKEKQAVANDQPKTSSNVTNLSCKDCWLAPVDKTHQLSSNYSPKVVATGLNGGGSMVVQASSALKELFAAAEAENVSPRVISSYRSYGEQVNTFNYWTQKVMIENPGLSRAAAEEKANVFSARPGQSEHQLGTTVDLKCASCSSFDNSAGNLALYTFLENNAHKYGFAISYAKDTTQYTGYKYEPWHIRFIGAELATELFNTGYLNSNGNYLAKFLVEKNLY